MFCNETSSLPNDPMRAFSDEALSLPNDSMWPLFEQIKILSGIQTVYSDCKYIQYIYMQPSMMASLGFRLWAKALRGQKIVQYRFFNKLGLKKFQVHRPSKHLQQKIMLIA